MIHTDSDLHTTYIGASRRKSPRIEVMGQLHGQLVAMDVQLVVRDVGAGGFGVESDIPFPLGASHQFRFSTETGLKIVVCACARHCHPTPGPDGTTRYRAGFAFVDDEDGETARAVERLLEAATSVLMFR